MRLTSLYVATETYPRLAHSSMTRRSSIGGVLTDAVDGAAVRNPSLRSKALSREGPEPFISAKIGPRGRVMCTEYVQMSRALRPRRIYAPSPSRAGPLSDPPP